MKGEVDCGRVFEIAGGLQELLDKESGDLVEELYVLKGMEQVIRWVMLTEGVRLENEAELDLALRKDFWEFTESFV